MIGSVSQGSSSAIDELKGLLDVVSDPAKMKAALDQIKKDKEVVLDLFNKGQAQLQAIAAKEKEIASREASVIEREKSAQRLEGECAAAAAKNEADRLENHRNRSNLDDEKAGFELFKANYLAEAAKRSENLEKRLSAVLDDQRKVDALKADLLAKQESLKKIMGV